MDRVPTPVSAQPAIRQIGAELVNTRRSISEPSGSAEPQWGQIHLREKIDPGLTVQTGGETGGSLSEDSE